MTATASPAGLAATAAPAVSFEGVLAAAQRIGAVLPMTPAWSYPLLDAALGATVYVKHENVQPTGAFKIRGGINLLATLPAHAREAGLITVSTGNHAQSLAYASRAAGVAATIVMPLSAPAVKVDAVAALGASVVVTGETMSEATAAAQELAARDGLYFVNPGNEPAIIHGHATVYLELLTAHPCIETLYVPVGSGSGLAGAILVRDAIAPQTRIVGVQAEGAPAAYVSWRSGALETAPIDTFASGLATGAGFALPQSVMRGRLDDFVLVSDAQLREAMALMATNAHTLCEGAGAAGLAAIMADAKAGRLAGTVGFACTGGNACTDEIGRLGA